MRTLTIIFIYCTFIICAIASDDIEPRALLRSWTEFKNTHRRRNLNRNEELLRFNIFSKNLAKIRQHNALYDQNLTTYRLGITQFADMTPQEFVALNRLKPLNLTAQPKFKLMELKSTEPLPKAVDWRTKGAVTEVKDQGLCGSCWSFSATGSLETQHFLQTGELVSLSEQQLIDCSIDYGNYGCAGGLMSDAFEYVIDHGLTSEEAYPYEHATKSCRSDGKPTIIQGKSYVQVESENEEMLAHAVASIGPISVAVDASNWQLYSDGIFKTGICHPGVLNHGVLAVGYDEDQNGKYWVIKNSWGTSWGKDGYMKLAKDAGNHCGVASMASYPLL